VNRPNDHQWQKSSYSGGGDGAECIEVAAAEGVNALREGDEPCATVAATPVALAGLIRHIKRAG
jgi:hypothetical protein